MPRVTVEDGLALSYRDVGEGDPLVLVHGGFMSERVFDYQVAALAEDYRVIAPNLRGHAGNDAPVGTCTHPRYFADDVHALLESLDVTDATYAGWSLGATIGIQYLRNPDHRLRRAVCFSSGTFHGLADLLAARAGEKEADGGLDFSGMIANFRDDYPSAIADFAAGLFHQDVGQETLDWFARIGMETPLYVAVEVLQLYESLEYEPLAEALEDADVPVEVWQGGNDAAATIPEGERVFEELVKDGRFVPFEESAHVPFVEERETFTEELRHAMEPE